MCLAGHVSSHRMEQLRSAGAPRAVRTIGASRPASQACFQFSGGTSALRKDSALAQEPLFCGAQHKTPSDASN